MSTWPAAFTANDLPGVYIPALNLILSGASATDAEVIAARGGTLSLSLALDSKAGVSHMHDADHVTSGVFAVARLGNGAATEAKYLRGDGSWQPLPEVTVSSLDQSGATDGQVLAWSATSGAWIPISPGSAGAVAWGSVVGMLSAQADLQAALDAKTAVGHTHDASAIVSGSLALARIPSLPGSIIGSGTVATARLGSGTPSGSVWLRGDGTWAALPPASGAAWGTITGSIISQPDLWSELANKAPSSHVGAGGSAHAAATALADGFMTSAQVTKLSGIASGATANSSDALLLNRANHTGSQPQSTVTNLVSDLAAKATLGVNTYTGVQTAPDFTSTSDARFKTDVIDLVLAPAALRPVRYRRIDTDAIEIGFVAQEVRELYPEAVIELPDGTLTLAYPRLTAALAAELADLRRSVSDLIYLSSTQGQTITRLTRTIEDIARNLRGDHL